MTDPATFFADKLRESAENFIWAVGQVPVERQFMPPPTPLGEWSVMRNVFHMMHYERTIALPTMRQWLGEPRPPRDAWLQEEAIWNGGQGHERDRLLADFRAGRTAQIALLSRFDTAAWEEPRVAIWGPAETTLTWTITKTYQHTFEHTNTILHIALFADMIVERLRAGGAESG